MIEAKHIIEYVQGAVRAWYADPAGTHRKVILLDDPPIGQFRTSTRQYVWDIVWKEVRWVDKRHLHESREVAQGG